MEVEEDGVIEGEAQQDADELEFLRIIEAVRVEPEEAGWREEEREGGKEGGWVRSSRIPTSSNSWRSLK